MAPLSASSSREYLPSSSTTNDFVRAVLSSSHGYTPGFTPHQQYVAQVIALTASSVSIVASVITSYWFLKMKRSFRHHLIMLLIQSNVLKAIWLFISPIVALTSEPLRTGSAYCDASGFLFVVAIEASDLAILMIAIHTALYILRPIKSMGHAGLYPYRKYAYAVWVIFPLVIASLAFINPKDAYISQSTFCLLRMRPYWYRIALSWVPRYAIFCTIIVVYASIYMHVKLQFRGFKGQHAQTQKNHDSWLSDGNDQQDGSYDMTHQTPLRGPPSTPKLIRHGLLPSSEDLSPEAQSTPARLDGSTTTQNIPANTDTTTHPPQHIPARAQPSWEALTFNTYPASLLPVEEDSEPSTTPTDTTSPSGSTTPDSASTKAATPPTPHLLAALHLARPSPRRSPSSPPEALTLASFLSSGPDFNAAQQRKRRAQTQRQLTLLFLYPLLYILMWIVPFVAHCRSYSDAYVARPSFALSCAVTVSLALQAAVDCLVFVLREKPWLHIPGSRRTVGDSFCFWAHRRGGRRDPLSLAAAAPVGGAGGAGGGGRLDRVADEDVERWFRLGAMRSHGDPWTEMALQARGRFLRSESDRERRLVFVRRKVGEGGRKMWWEVEGAWRNDSGLLGERVAASTRARGEMGGEV